MVKMGSKVERIKRHVEGDIDDNQEIREVSETYIVSDENGFERIIDKITEEDITDKVQPYKTLRTNPYIEEGELSEEELKPAKPKYNATKAIRELFNIKEESKMTTKNNRVNNSAAVTRQAAETFQQEQKKPMSDAEFLAPRKVNKIGTFANAEELANYSKASDVEGIPMLFNRVDIRDGNYMGKPTRNAYMDCTIIETGEEVRVINSGFMVVRQLEVAQETDMFPFSAMFVSVPLDKGQTRWELQDIPE